LVQRAKPLPIIIMENTLLITRLGTNPKIMEIIFSMATLIKEGFLKLRTSQMIC